MAVEVGRDEIAGALAAVGLRRGDGVFLQASMSALGRIRGGPDAVIDAIEDVVGPDALVAMPAFPFGASMIEYVRGRPRFDVRSTPAATGTVSERFRKLPGTVRSLHPTHSVCARGPGSESLVEGHDRADTPFGTGTPFERMARRGMHQLWLGAGMHAFTIYHLFECLQGARFPITVFLPQPFAIECIDESGRQVYVETLVHDPHVASRQRRSASRQELWQRLHGDGTIRKAPVGASMLHASRIPELLEALERLLEEEGLTIYDSEARRSPAGRWAASSSS